MIISQNEQTVRDNNFAKNQKLEKLYKEIMKISKEEKKFNADNKSYSGRLELTYHMNNNDYVEVYCDLRGYRSEPVLKFKTSFLFAVTSRKWLPLFSEKTTPEKVLKIIFELRDKINQHNKGRQDDVEKQNKKIEKIKKDLASLDSRLFRLSALGNPSGIFQHFEFENINNQQKIKISPNYDCEKYDLVFKLNDVKAINLAKIIKNLIKLEVM